MTDYLPFSAVRQMPEFTDYYQAAKRFCSFLEENNCLTTVDFLICTRAQLLHLYTVALAMPWVDLQSNEDFEEKLSVDAFQKVLQGVAEQLGEVRYYWHVLDPVNDFDAAPVCGDVLDDLCDIYKDLKYSLMIFGLGKQACEENALWQLKSDFDAHWSRHCINALSAIHFYLEQFK